MFLGHRAIHISIIGAKMFSYAKYYRLTQTHIHTHTQTHTHTHTPKHTQTNTHKMTHSENPLIRN